MGRKNKAYFKDLHQQAYDRLTGMQAFGESKKEAVANGTEKDKIFAFNTYKSYWKHTKYFIKYIKEKHPECTTLKSAKKYANEWLQTRVDQGLSAWTVQLEAKALGKLYGISSDDENYFNPPKRKREEIKRSRGDRVRDKHFSKTNNDELIKFCRGTACGERSCRSCGGRTWFPGRKLRRRSPSCRRSQRSSEHRASQNALKCSRTHVCFRRSGLSMSATERADESV